MKFRILATDYDGTLATDGVVDDATLSQLQHARASGIRLFMVTGREIDDLKRVFSHLTLFESIVAENGAVIFDPLHGTEQVLAPPPPPQLLQQLKDHGVPISVGRSIIGTTSSHEQTVLEIIQELGLDWHIILNKGAVMILPPGVNKATGLSALLKQLGIPPQQVVAVGDAENDQAFLQFCGYPVAVANALPAIKQIAAFVTSSPRGAGVSELITRMLEDSLPPNNKPGPSV